MSEHFDANQIDEAKDSEQSHRTPGPALPIISLVASIAGAAIGYYINWPVGVVLVITSIVCGVLARKRRAPYRWAATIGIIISALCLVVCVVVVSIVMYQMQQMNNLLS